MHVRLPTPLHGWRAFFGEVGVIVLGVLIALGFGDRLRKEHRLPRTGSTSQPVAAL